MKNNHLQDKEVRKTYCYMAIVIHMFCLPQKNHNRVGIVGILLHDICTPDLMPLDYHLSQSMQHSSSGHKCKNVFDFYNI